MKRNLCITVEDNVYDRLRECSEKMGVSMSAFISILISQYGAMYAKN